MKKIKCERCGVEFKPITEKNTFCQICTQDIINEELYNEEHMKIMITREMAMDAGYPEMEGQEIFW